MTPNTPNKTERRKPGDVARVLVIDDEDDIRELLDLTLVRMGLSADCAGSVKQAKEFLAREEYSLCLTDMRLPDGEGLEIVQLIGEKYPATPVAVITAFGSADNAVAALKAGAFDYLAKPLALDQLRSLVKSAISLPTPAGEKLANEKGIQLIGDSPAMQAVRTMIAKLARSQAPVYVSGESGSGKELAARLIHQESTRNSAPFVPVNCGAIPENLMESEFFGYRKGAFTGADSDREGFFQAAHGGTLFLDEVADLPLAMQVKLLRALQEKKVRKLGSTVEESIDVRIISATHKQLKNCVDSGAFRQDLYYRLNVIELKMPSLRERQEDIQPLINAMLERLCGDQAPVLCKEALRELNAYSYPGNVRELENILERASALCVDGKVKLDDLQLGDAQSAASDGSSSDQRENLEEHINRVEKQLIIEALNKTSFNRTAAARLLGVSFRSLRYRIDRLGIEG